MSNSITVAQERELAIKQRPAYLPAVAEDDPIHQIQQRLEALPIMSLNNDDFTLMQGMEVIKRFGPETADLTLYLAHANKTVQRRAYEGEYDEDQQTDPICQSEDGVHALKFSREIQSEDGTCANCWRSQESTARSDKCSYMRNALVLVEYTNDQDGVVSVLARLRLNGNTLFGKESRENNEYNAETVIRECKRLNAQLWYHPLIAWFDKVSKNARNKLLFQLEYNDYIPEELAAQILEFSELYDFDELTRLKAPPVDDDDDEGSTDGQQQPRGAEASAKAAPQRGRAAAKRGDEKASDAPASTSAAKKTKSRAKPAKRSGGDSSGDDSERAGAATTARDSGEKAPDAGGDAAAEPKAGRAAGRARGRARSEQPGNERDAEPKEHSAASDEYVDNPLFDPELNSMIENVELP